MITRDATTHTARANSEFVAALPQDDPGWDDAHRGFIAAAPTVPITTPDGLPVFDVAARDFTAESTPPATVNPSLWRLARLNAVQGLFQVTDRIYQLRGLDISNMTIVVGESGYIVIDPLLSVETARAGMALVREQLGDRAVTGIIYTHCHLDHFGGVEGVITPERAAEDRIPVIAPAAFVQHAINENLYSGAAEARRNTYMFGAALPPGPRGHVTSGIGVAVSTGTSTLIAPTITVPAEGLRLEVDGVEIVFSDASGAEAPSEMHFSFPQFGAVCLAENATQVMHNLYTLRGAPVRDALFWSEALEEARRELDPAAEIAFMSHHWPVFGRERILDYLGKQRDLYRFIHDETLRLANHGLKPGEIAEAIRLPDALSRYWPNRGTYGSLKVNARAVYQRYLGWYDGNPATLDPLPPREVGARYVDAIGGPDRVMDVASEAYDAGDYRWCAELLSHLIASGRETSETAGLQADTFEQLGYQAEASTWRNFYLSAAQDLRAGENTEPPPSGAKRNFSSGMSRRMLLDYLAIRFNGSRGAELVGTILLRLPDVGELWLLTVRNGVLRASECRDDERADAELVVDSDDFSRFAQGLSGLESAERGGDTGLLSAFEGLLDTFSGKFSLVRPNTPGTGEN